MIEYRVTKYNPALRDARGAYTAHEWTSISDIGKSFGGVVLTQTEYQRVEPAHITATLAFLAEAGIAWLAVEEFENHANLVLRRRRTSANPRSRLIEGLRPRWSTDALYGRVQ